MNINLGHSHEAAVSEPCLCLKIMHTSRLTRIQYWSQFISYFFACAVLCFSPPSHAALQHGGPSRGDFISGREVFLICSRPSISVTALWPFGELGVWGREVESSTANKDTVLPRFVSLSHTQIHNAFCLSESYLAQTRHTWQSRRGSVNPANESQSAEGRDFSLFMIGHSSARPWEPTDWNSEFIAILTIPHSLCSEGSEIYICTITSCSNT